MNRVTSATDPLSHEEQSAYDAWGRVVTLTHADSTTVSKSYSATSQLIGVTDENSHTTNLAYDDAGRLTSTTNARSDVESYGYDAANHRTSVEDGNSHTRNYTFTNRGEVATLTLADSSEEQWSYDGNGNCTAYENPLSQTIDYVFDNAGRETGIDYPTGTDTSFSFDNADRRTGMTDATGTTTWGYDNASRLTSLSTPQGNMTYTFDNQGNRSTMVEGVGTTSYSYDADNRCTSLENPYSETTGFTFDAAGRLTQKTFASGAYDVYGYDSRNRMTSLSHKNSGGTVLSSESYAFDYSSNMTSKTVDSITTTYTVDAINQLLSESKTGYSASYTYDSNGNRASQTLNGTTYNYSYDSGDKLNTIKVGSTTVKSYGYDADGRTTSVVTSAGTTTLSYDYESRITGITYPSTATNSFTYNGLDTRVGKVDSSGTSTYKRDGAEVTSAVLSDGSIAYTPGISERKSSATTFDHADYLGTLTRQTNSSQSTTATRIYDSFGNLESSTGTPQSPFGFVGGQGYQEDGDSGLKLLGHRYYDSSTGRFLTRDPARAGRNWSIYASNAPTTRTDSSGLFDLDDVSNFFAGWGDTLTSGGTITTITGKPVTQIVREWMGTQAGIDTGSGSYTGGQIVGSIHTILLGEEFAALPEEVAALPDEPIETNWQDHHVLPKGIQSRLPADAIPPGAANETAGLPVDWHQGPTGIHGSSGPAGPYGSVGGGAYNNWWHNTIMSNGGYNQVTSTQIRAWMDFLGDEFGW